MIEFKIVYLLYAEREKTLLKIICNKNFFKRYARNKMEKEMATPPASPAFLPGESHGHGGSDGLQSMGLQRVRHS